MGHRAAPLDGAIGVMIPGPGVSSGGLTGQLLRKKSSTDFDTEWVTFEVYTKAEVDAIVAGIDTGGGAIDLPLAMTDVTGLQAAIDGKAAVGHDHLADHYTKAEANAQLAGKSGVGHNHDDLYYTQAGVDALLAGYYTGSEVNDLLTGYQPLDAALSSIAALSLAGQAGKFLRVNAAETGFELASVIGADVTEPVLTAASGTSTGTTTADLQVTTDEGNGTLYWVVTTNVTTPTKAQIKAGQDHTGTTSVPESGNVPVAGTGVQTDTATLLSASTTYWVHFMHEDAAGNQSTPITSASFTTDAAGLGALILGDTDTHVAGTNPPTWKSTHDGDVQPWDAGTSSGDKHKMRFRLNGGAWTEEVYQELDDELMSGGFSWPLFIAARPFLAGTVFEVQERRSRWAAGVQVAESDWSNTWSDTLGAIAPLSIAPSGWVKPADVSTLFQSGTRGAEGTAISADGQAVRLVLDKSGNNIDFTAAAGAGPLYRVGTSYTDWLEFDGVDDILSNIAPNISNYPFSVGFWFIPTANDDVLVSLTDTGVADPGSRAVMSIDSAGKPQIAARGSGAPQNAAAVASAFTSGQPHYAVYRYIGTNNRRIAVLFPSGTIEHAQTTTGITFNSLDALFIGAYKHSAATLFGQFTGKIGELWWKNADIQPDGLQLDDDTILQLAYGGVAL